MGKLVAPKVIFPDVGVKVMFPEPFGTIAILPFDTQTMVSPLTSSAPPSCGLVSSTIFASPAVDVTVTTVSPALSGAAMAVDAPPDPAIVSIE